MLTDASHGSGAGDSALCRRLAGPRWWQAWWGERCGQEGPGEEQGLDGKAEAALCPLQTSVLPNATLP